MRRNFTVASHAATDHRKSSCGHQKTLVAPVVLQAQTASCKVITRLSKYLCLANWQRTMRYDLPSKQTKFTWSEVNVDVCTKTLTFTGNNPKRFLKAIKNLKVRGTIHGERSVHFSSEEDLNLVLLLVPGGEHLHDVKRRCNIPPSPPPPPPPPPPPRIVPIPVTRIVRQQVPAPPPPNDVTGAFWEAVIRRITS